MFFYLRNLSPLVFDEFTAEVAIEALEWHSGHLRNQSNEARDRVDRPAWGLAQLRLKAVASLRSTIQDELRALGPTPPEAADYHASMIQRRGAKLPQSAANAHILRAERVVRDEAVKERKAAYWERVEAGRRMAGGKWSRPEVREASKNGLDDQTMNSDVG